MAGRAAAGKAPEHTVLMHVAETLDRVPVVDRSAGYTVAGAVAVVDTRSFSSLSISADLLVN